MARKPETPPKRTFRVRKQYNADHGTVTFDCVTGSVAKGDVEVVSEAIVVDLSALPSAMRSQAMAHGIAQKLGDATAKDAETIAAGYSPEDAIADMQAMYDRVQDGDWTTKRESSGGATGGMLLEAIVKLKVAAGETVDNDARQAIRAKLRDKDVRAGALANEEIAAEYERVRAERQAGKTANVSAASLADF